MCFSYLQWSTKSNEDPRYDNFAKSFKIPMKYFKYLEYCEILSPLAINIVLLLRFKIQQIKSKIRDLKKDLSIAKYKIYSIIKSVS